MRGSTRRILKYSIQQLTYTRNSWNAVKRTDSILYLVIGYYNMVLLQSTGLYLLS
jgi:hypothetical protein